jgi:hypothetical protein
MWPFSSSTKQDARVREAWGKFPWIGLEGHYEHIKRKGALRRWARKVAARAEAGKTPVLISVGADYGVAEDRTTGKTVWWGNSLRLVCPAVPEGVEVIRQAFDSFDGPFLDLGSTHVAEQRFASFDEALAWCARGTTWRCRTDARPPN